MSRLPCCSKVVSVGRCQPSRGEAVLSHQGLCSSALAVFLTQQPQGLRASPCGAQPLSGLLQLPMEMEAAARP